MKDGETTVLFLPYWRGGMPKDGGGFDKEMMKTLKEFKVGDKVKISWTFEEHHRIDSIAKVERPANNLCPFVIKLFGRDISFRPSRDFSQPQNLKINPLTSILSPKGRGRGIRRRCCAKPDGWL